MNVYYGLVLQKQVVEYARAVVAAVDGVINPQVVALLVETASQETMLGGIKDPSRYTAGAGLCQCDPIGFKDVVARTPSSIKACLVAAFDIYLDEVQYVELNHSPLLAMIFCRLHYKLVPEPIPLTVVGRASYWKKWYNSTLGAGKPEQYIANATAAATLIGGGA